MTFLYETSSAATTSQGAIAVIRTQIIDNTVPWVMFIAGIFILFLIACAVYYQYLFGINAKEEYKKKLKATVIAAVSIWATIIIILPMVLTNFMTFSPIT